MTTTNNERSGDTVNTTIATTTTTVVKTEEVAILDAVAEQVETLIAEFNNAKTAIKTLEDKKAEAEAALRELLGSAKKGTIEGIERRGRVLLIGVVMYGVATVAFGLSHAYWLTFLCLALTGAADTVSMVIRNIIRQTHTPDTMRGRMTSVNMVFFMGGPQLGELEAGNTLVRHYGPNGETTPEDLVNTPTLSIFVESFAPQPQMWIFGAVDFTAALARVAKILGYRVTVCDAREIFATRRRFPMADNVVVSWPGDLFTTEGKNLGPRDAVCILTHDAKFDVPAVKGALATRVGYIGVMGSRKTHTKRLERLAEVGVSSPADLARLMSPIGLDLGARTPEETAISICAEIIARRTGRNAPSLRDSSGPIHAN